MNTTPSPSEQFDTLTDDQTDPNAADANATDANADAPEGDDAIVEQVDAENGFVVPEGDDDSDNDDSDEGDESDDFTE